MEVDCLFIPSLTLTQACKLFRITKNKLNLEPQLIELQNLLSILVHMGRKKEDIPRDVMISPSIFTPLIKGAFA